MKLPGTFLFTALLALSASATVPLDRIVAVVGDSSILQSELSSYVAVKAQQLGIKPDSLEANIMRAKALEELIDGKVLLFKAEKDTNISITTADVEAELTNRINMICKSNNLTMAMLEEALKREQGMSVGRFKTELRSQIRAELLRQRMMSANGANAPLTRPEIETFYKEYKDSLPSVGQSVLLQTITLKNSASDSIRELAWKKIRTVKTRLDNNEEFALVAKELSEDPSAANGGDLGFVAKASLSEILLEEKIFSLKPGEYSDPFETRLGFHIVKALEKRDQMIHAQQVFIATAPPEKGFETISARLDSIRSASTSEKLFTDAVKALSQDEVSKATNGTLPWKNTASLEPEIRSGFDTLMLGAISRPVRSERSISLYRVKQMVADRKMTLADDWNEIAAMASRITAQKKLAAKIEKWREKVYVRYIH